MVDGPNKNFSRPFRAPKNGLPDWLRTYIETLQRGYYVKLKVQKDVEKTRRNVVPHEIKAKIEILKKAEAILEDGNLRYNMPGRWSKVEKSMAFDSAADHDEYRNDVRHLRKALAVRKMSILTLRRERKYLRIRLVKGPRGHQMNYMLDYDAWCLGQKIKEKTGKPNWELVAELLSEYLPIETMDANQALKAHRRFARLRNDREKFSRVILSNNINNNWFGRDCVVLNKKIRFAGPRNRVGPFTASVIAD